MTEPTPLRPIPLADAGGAVRRLFVRDLMVECSIGIHSHEHHGVQRVRVNVDLSVRDDRPVADRIANVISYDHIVGGVEAIVSAGHINLVETLAERIADLCLEDDKVERVEVRVEKLHAVAEAAGVGVEVVKLKTPPA